MGVLYRTGAHEPAKGVSYNDDGGRSAEKEESRAARPWQFKVTLRCWVEKEKRGLRKDWRREA